MNTASFEVTQATDLARSEMVRVVQDFSAKVAERGPRTVAMVYYAGHGVQVAGKTVSVAGRRRISSPSDLDGNSLRLVDLMGTLESIQSRMRIVVLDACRNNPFPEVNDRGRGLAIVDAPNGSIVGYSTAPGMEAQDGDGNHSPYTSAFLNIAREPNLPIEQLFKRIRLEVNNTTKGKQTPWESSSLTSDFYFFGDTAVASGRAPDRRPIMQAAANLPSRSVRQAYDYVLSEGSPEYYAEFIRLYPHDPLCDHIRELLGNLQVAKAYSERDFDGDELSGFSRLYLNAGGMASHDGSIGLLAGACLGGGTVVNYTFSFRTPEHVRREWASMGVPAVEGPAFDESLVAVWERISVNEEHSVPSLRDEAIRRGLDRLGWDSQVMKRNVRGCRAEVCRLCHYGCPLGAKQSTLKTWLQDAYDGGTRILVRTRADRVIVEGGAARGVEARTAAGHRVMVHSRAVVSTAGALNTPALLGRSGVRSKALGKHLRLHPVMVVWGQMEDEVRPWEGMLSATFSDEHADMDGKGYGIKYEHVATPPSILLSFSPWRGGRAHQDLMQALPFTAGVGVLLRDHGHGEVRLGRDGEPVVRYAFTAEDVDHLRRGIAGGAGSSRRWARG